MLLSSAAALLLTTAAWAADGLGFSVQITGEGFFMNPKVASAIVSEVKAGSAAERAGIQTGDELLSVGGQSVVGERVRALAPLIERAGKEPLQLKLRSATNDEIITIDLPVDDPPAAP